MNLAVSLCFSLAVLYLALLCVWNRGDVSEHELFFLPRWEVFHRLLPSTPSLFLIHFLPFLSEPSISKIFFWYTASWVLPHHLTPFHKGHRWLFLLLNPTGPFKFYVPELYGYYHWWLFPPWLSLFPGPLQSPAFRFPSCLSGSSFPSIFTDALQLPSPQMLLFHRFHPYLFLFTLHTSFRQHLPFLWLHTLSLSLGFGFIYSVSYWLFSLNFPWALHTQPGKKRTHQLLLNHSKIFLVLVALPPIPDKNLNYPRPLSQLSHSIPKSG